MFSRLASVAALGLALSLAWQQSTAQNAPSVSGQGKYRFRVLYTSTHLPAEAQAPAVLKAAHGGFAVDRRKGQGEIYFALPGAGIIQISSDLKSTRMIATDPSMRDTNMHNAQFWTAKDGSPFLTFPGNAANKVFTTKLDGTLVHTLNPPSTSDDLGNATANDYFAKGGKFIPTDVEELDGMYYIPTGYSSLDYVLTAKITGTAPFAASWNKLAFGGRGKEAGQFGTGHGIMIPPKSKRIEVADRPNSEIDRFTLDGQYVSTLGLPKGSFPCDIAYLDNFSVVGALHGPDRTKGAPIYLLEKDKLVSTIMPKEELGLANFQHVHNATIVKNGGKLYIVAQAWNPGDFAILEQVK